MAQEREVSRKAIGYVSYDPAHCMGCYTCMAVCSLSHEGAVWPYMARIQVDAPQLNIFNAYGFTCKQCETAECLLACTTGALHIDEATGAKVIDKDMCIGCKVCMTACPQYPNTPIRFNEEEGYCVKCDLCGGEPKCVKFCPMSLSVAPNVFPVEDHPLRFIMYSD